MRTQSDHRIRRDQDSAVALLANGMQLFLTASPGQLLRRTLPFRGLPGHAHLEPYPEAGQDLLTPWACAREDDGAHRFYYEMVLALLLLLLSGRVVQIPMQDGTLLTADLYLPAEKGKFPVVLARTPYDRWEGWIPRLVRAGFAVVVQNTRGRGDSQGIGLPYLLDEEDGWETVLWILRQPWSNGKLAMLGGSALGITQLLLAPRNPPGVRTFVPLVAPASLYHDAAYEGGRYRMSLVEGWLKGAGFPSEALLLVRKFPKYGQFWRALDLTRACERLRIPILLVGGWYDVFLTGTLRSWYCLQEGPAGPESALWIGPWTHKQMFQARVGEVALPALAEGKPLQRGILFWLARYLKGARVRLPRVWLYRLAPPEQPEKHAWLILEDYPPKTEIREFRFGEECTEIPVDPGNPVPTLGGRNMETRAGMADLRPYLQRSDVAVWRSAPLEEEITLLGAARLRLEVQELPEDPFLVAWLGIGKEEIWLVTDTGSRIQRGTNWLRFADTAFTLPAGYRLFLFVAGSNVPRWRPPAAEGVLRVCAPVLRVPYQAQVP